MHFASGLDKMWSESNEAVPSTPVADGNNNTSDDHVHGVIGYATALVTSFKKPSSRRSSLGTALGSALFTVSAATATPTKTAKRWRQHELSI